MKAIVNGKIVLPDRIAEGKALVFGERIEGVFDEVPAGAEVVDARGMYVLPGLFDMHIHGYLGEDASDGSYEGLVVMAGGVAKNGVTAFLPTTMTVSKAELRTAFAAIRKLMADGEAPDWAGARAVGINAEGPFINPAKKGAQAGEHIVPGDAAFLLEYPEVRQTTIAPEMHENLACVRELSESGIVVSIGHTNATYVQAREAIETGARNATHLFNAMPPLNHRDPGAVGAALEDDRVYCELIADAFHIHPGLFSILRKLKGDRLVLVTDCTRAGGLADGEYSLGGQPIFVKGIECRLSDGTIAGSVLRLNHAIRNMVRMGGAEVWEAVNMASRNPAKLHGRADIGSLEPGKRADIAIADEDFEIHATILGGQTIYERGNA
jgi:N-acetylglucosamine-6-phosphate deacetylase